MQLVIREAISDDAEALLSYAADLFSERLPGLWSRALPTLEEERDFIRSYSAANSVLVLAIADGKIAGVAGIMGRSLAQESHVGVLAISVTHDYRARGIGTALVRHLMTWAPTAGVSRIEVEAFANNPRAIALYERLGFEREGMRHGAVVVDEEFVDVVCLGWGPVK